ncbi:hypothetical protein V6C03_08630 [Methyloligella sp. 2.7D]|uniref:tetratricopeptide repeat protein n=1 Tax=unclassified Methyloligella TaxID=2625955 RepID=UPI00157DBEAF|nr:hypothetical protein [Methyloligella sp. GL2]QKP78066.1 hypothetical protein HT051_11820 [Methyloligella sp. GL2]
MSLAHRIFARSRGPALWLVLFLGLAGTVFTGWQLVLEKQENAKIAALLGGENLEVELDKAGSKLLAARGYYLLTRDRMEQAQPVLDQANWRADPKDRTALLYNMANTRMRLAYEQVRVGHFEKGISLVNLAKDEYRRALHIEPEDWDAKFNLDVSMRLVRDLPQANLPEDEEDEQQPPSQMWTDLPGTPQGAP